MSQAQALLNSLEDTNIATASATITWTEERIVVDEDRSIHVPDSLKRLGVQHDHNIETVTFECPRYWDGHDLSQMKIYINYLCPDGTKGQYLTESVAAVRNTMTFTWVVSNNVTRAKGTLSFLVCIVKVDEEGNEERHWNSELNQECYISEGLECDEIALVNYPDIITQLLIRMDQVEENTNPAKLALYTHKWLEENRAMILAEIEAKGLEVLESIPEDYTEAYNKAEASVRTRANAIVLSSDGEQIVIDNSSDDHIRGLKLHGKSVQLSTTGVQLFDSSGTTNSLVGTATVEENGAKITVTGTYYVSWPINMTAGAEYYIDFTTSGNTATRGVRFQYADLTLSDIITNPTAFTPTMDVAYVYLYSGMGTSATVIYKNFQISKGSTASAWEPYSGGVASPSPDWPQNIVGIDNPTITIAGKNLWDNASATIGNNTWIARTDTGFTFTRSETGGTYVCYKIPLAKGTTVTFSCDCALNPPYLYLYKDKVYGSSVKFAKGKITHTVIEDLPDATFAVIISSTDESTTVSNIQVEINTDNTEYEKYKSVQTTTYTTMPISFYAGTLDCLTGAMTCAALSIPKTTEWTAGNTTSGWVHGYNSIGQDTIPFHYHLGAAKENYYPETLCTHFPAAKSWSEIVSGTTEMAYRGNTTSGLAFEAIRIKRSRLVDYGFTDDGTLETANTAFMAWLSDNRTLRFLGEINTAVQLPPFDPHTNYPVTTILNRSMPEEYEGSKETEDSLVVSVGSGAMEVDYNADTQTYLNNLPKATDDQVQAAVDAWLSAHYSTAEGVSF